MPSSANKRRLSVKVQKIHRASLHTPRSKLGTSSVVHVKVHSANSRSSIVNSSYNEDDDLSLVRDSLFSMFAFTIRVYCRSMQILIVPRHSYSLLM